MKYMIYVNVKKNPKYLFIYYLIDVIIFFKQSGKFYQNIKKNITFYQLPV